jgi:hypothetical protein
VNTVVDLAPAPVDPTRLPARRRMSEIAYERLLATDPLLHPLRSPEVTCEVDVSVVDPTITPGWAQVHSRQGRRDDRVAVASSAGRSVEVATFGVEHWQTELARAARVRVPARAPTPPEPVVEAPFEVLLAAGEAIRAGRPEVLDELVRRADDAEPVALRDQLVRLHTAVVGRLLAVVAARDDGRVRAGWLSWLLFADGWRSLDAVRRDARPLVRLTTVRPMDLGRQVASLVSLVEGRP